MNLNKFHDTLNTYEQELEKLPETTPNTKLRTRALDMLPSLRHLLGHLGPEGRLTDEQKLAMVMKVNRWLGFLQAILWTLNLLSVDNARRHVRLVFKQ